MISLVLWTVLFFNPYVTFAASDLASSKTLKILQIDFSNKSEPVQKTLLRNMALLNTEEAIPFFVSTALETRYPDDVRREALKGMLAVDSKKYGAVLEILQSQTLEDEKLIRTLQTMDDVDLFLPFLSSISFSEEQKMIDMKISATLGFWKEKKINEFDFSNWPSAKASEIFVKLIQTTDNTTQKSHLIALWGKIRDEKSTKEMVKLLDHPNFRVKESTIMALSEPGESAIPALGRFLQKSKNPLLRKRTIFAIGKINNEASKVALETYLPKATKEEKKWINDILLGRQK